MKWKKIFFAGIFILTLTTGCSVQKEEAADKTKILSIAYPDTITTLDIADDTAATMLKETAGVVETLVSVDSDFQLHPMLAAEWQRLDDFTWDFQLREDVLFHDGTKMNAEAVKWCLERNLEENVSLTGTTGIQSVEVLDEFAVRFHMAVKTGDLPEALTNVNTAIIAKSSVDENGEFIKAVGTGFFQQDAFDLSSGKFECVPFDKYWQDVETGIERRIIFSMPDSSARSLAAQNGEIDLATDVPFSDLETLEKKQGITVEKYFTARSYFYSYNLNTPYLQDSRVRKALIYAINKQEIVDEVLLGVGTAPKGIFMEDMPWANTEVERYDYDAEKAKSLLEQAGILDSDGDGFLDWNGEKITVRIITSSRRPGCSLIAQATQGYFLNLGIDTTVEVLEVSAMNQTVSQGEFDLVLNSAATGYVPSASYYLNTYYHSQSVNGQQIHYKNEKLDTLIEECKATDNLEEKYRLSKEAQKIAQEDAAVFTVANYGAVFILSDTLENFTYSAAVHDFIVPNETDKKETAQ